MQADTRVALYLNHYILDLYGSRGQRARNRERCKVTCLDKAVVEVKPEQGSPHAWLLAHRRRHGALDRRKRARAGRVVERRRQLSRRRRGQAQQQQDRRRHSWRNDAAAGKPHDHLSVCLVERSMQVPFLCICVYVYRPRSSLHSSCVTVQLHVS